MSNVNDQTFFFSFIFSRSRDREREREKRRSSRERVDRKRRSRSRERKRSRSPERKSHRHRSRSRDREEKRDRDRERSSKDKGDFKETAHGRKAPPPLFFFDGCEHKYPMISQTVRGRRRGAAPRKTSTLTAMRRPSRLRQEPRWWRKGRLPPPPLGLTASKSSSILKVTLSPIKTDLIGPQIRLR